MPTISKGFEPITQVASQNGCCCWLRIPVDLDNSVAEKSGHVGEVLCLYQLFRKKEGKQISIISHLDWNNFG